MKNILFKHDKQIPKYNNNELNGCITIKRSKQNFLTNSALKIHLYARATQENKLQDCLRWGRFAFHGAAQNHKNKTAP